MKIKKRYLNILGGLIALMAFLLIQSNAYTDNAAGRAALNELNGNGVSDFDESGIDSLAITPSDFQAESVNIGGLIVATLILGLMLATGVILGRRRLLDSRPKKK